MFCASIIDPVGDERPHAVKKLPERHDLPSYFRWSQLSNVYRAGSECNTLAEADNDTASNESGQRVEGGKRLHECGNYGEYASNGHSPTSSQIIGQRTSKEPSCDNGTDSVRGIDSSDQFSALNQCYQPK